MDNYTKIVSPSSSYQDLYNLRCIGNTVRRASLNIRSVINKLDDIHQILTTSCSDILALSETHLSDNIPSDVLEMTDLGYLFPPLRLDGPSSSSGGLVIYAKVNLNPKLIEQGKLNLFISR